jgi:hypothetical protein
MGTSKYIALSLLIALAGIVSGQDQPAASSKAAQPGPSNTHSASCILRITVDPAIMPLNPETVSSLIHSPAVLFKAAHDVWSIGSLDDFNLLCRPPEGEGQPRLVFSIRWLNASPASAAPGFTQPKTPLPNPDQKGDVKPDQVSATSFPLPARSPGENDAQYRTRVQVIHQQQQMQLAALRAQQQALSGLQGTPQLGAGMEQSAMIELQVNLSDKVAPSAQEFLQKVFMNLRDSLRQAYEVADENLVLQHGEAEKRYYDAKEFLQSASESETPGAVRIRKQLDADVDLSSLTPQTPLKEAIDVLRKSVEPPLNIVVLWNDLANHVSVTPTSPINISGMPKVRLGNMLDLLVKGFIPGSAKPMWKIQDDTIVIGTTVTLSPAAAAAGQQQLATDAVNLGGQRSDLVRKMQTLELDLAGIDARRKAIQEQIAAIQAAAGKQLAQDRVTQELEQLQHTNAINLGNIKKQADAGRVTATELAQAEESAARIRIDLARRREELSRQAGGAQLEEFTKELSHLAIDKAEKEAQLQMVHRQLDEVQRQLAQALTFDPEAARLRLAQESLEIAGRRMTELQARRVNLPLPTVTLIGAN